MKSSSPLPVYELLLLISHDHIYGLHLFSSVYLYRRDAFQDLEGSNRGGLLPCTVRKPILDDREGTSRTPRNRFEIFASRKWCRTCRAREQEETYPSCRFPRENSFFLLHQTSFRCAAMRASSARSPRTSPQATNNKMSDHPRVSHLRYSISMRVTNLGSRTTVSQRMAEMRATRPRRPRRPRGRTTTTTIP